MDSLELVSGIPEDSPNGVYGDIEAFLSKFEEGFFHEEYQKLCKSRELSDDMVRIWMMSLNERRN